MIATYLCMSSETRVDDSGFARVSGEGFIGYSVPINCLEANDIASDIASLFPLKPGMIRKRLDMSANLQNRKVAFSFVDEESRDERAA